MKDTKKPKQQLINELAELRRRIADLEKEKWRRRVDEALQFSETRYRWLFETAQDGILLLDADTGKITYVNPFLIDMLGYSIGHRLRISSHRDILKKIAQSLVFSRYLFVSS